MEAIFSTETPVLTRATRRRHIAEDSILSYRGENITFYLASFFFYCRYRTATDHRHHAAVNEYILHRNIFQIG
jgi:hypothetical protein